MHQHGLSPTENEEGPPAAHAAPAVAPLTSTTDTKPPAPPPCSPTSGLRVIVLFFSFLRSPFSPELWNKDRGKVGTAGGLWGNSCIRQVRSRGFVPASRNKGVAEWSSRQWANHTGIFPTARKHARNSPLYLSFPWRCPLRSSGPPRGSVAGGATGCSRPNHTLTVQCRVDSV